ncbi:hypothetical protein [Cupriavidus necator]|uniref:hypothetical protein n=1 Tax=Cupriavidus necator TaxID=106590 RepID=UPI001F33B158|nr:hypothetical protein [Cupriavidus necator]
MERRQAVDPCAGRGRRQRLSMEVGTGLLEVTVTAYPQQLECGIDPKFGANVLGLRDSH